MIFVDSSPPWLTNFLLSTILPILAMVILRGNVLGEILFQILSLATGQDLPDERQVHHDQRLVHYNTGSSSRVPYEDNAPKRFRSSSEFFSPSRSESHGPAYRPPPLRLHFAPHMLGKTSICFSWPGLSPPL